MSDSTAVNCGFFDGYPLGRHQKRFLKIAAVAYAFDMFDGMLFGFVQPVLMEQWGLSMEKMAQLSSLNFIGAFIGGIIGGWLADRIGRKKAMLSMIALFSMATWMTAVTQPYHILLLELGRFLTGIGGVAMTVIAIVYISEMMPAEGRGKYQALTVAGGTIAIPLGAMLAKVVIPMGPESWRMVFWIGGASILLSIFGMKILPESPRWLVQHGKVAEAEQIVEECIGVNTDLSNYATTCTESKASLIYTLKLMFSKNYLKRSLVVFCIAWGVLIGNSYLMNWFPTLLSGMGIPIATVLTVFSLANWGTPVGDIICSFFSDKGGRKMPIVIFSIITGACYIGLGLVGGSLVGFAILFFIKSIFGGGAATMMWSYLAESFPTEVRNSASGIVFGGGRLVVAASMYTIPLLLNSVGYLGLTTFNAMLFIIPAILIAFMGEKTAQVTLEELERH